MINIDNRTLLLKAQIIDEQRLNKKIKDRDCLS